MKKKIQGEIIGSVIWIIISGGLLFWFLDPILAVAIFVILFFIIIKVGLDSIRSIYLTVSFLQEGLELKKLIPAYFCVPGIRGNYPDHNRFAVEAGSDPYALFNGGEYLHLYKCQIQVYPNGNQVDEYSVPYWLIGDVVMKIPKQDIVTIELHQIILNEREINRQRSTNFWKWYRTSAHPILKYTNLKVMHSNIVLTLVLNEKGTNRYLSFAIPDKIIRVVDIPWTEFVPDWVQSIDEFLEISSEVLEYAGNNEYKEKEFPALSKAKIMAAQIKSFVPQVKVCILKE